MIPVNSLTFGSALFRSKLVTEATEQSVPAAGRLALEEVEL